MRFGFSQYLVWVASSSQFKKNASYLDLDKKKINIVNRCRKIILLVYLECLKTCLFNLHQSISLLGKRFLGWLSVNIFFLNVGILMYIVLWYLLLWIAHPWKWVYIITGELKCWMWVSVLPSWFPYNHALHIFYW